MPFLVDPLIVILIGWFFISQLIVPTIKKQPLCPALRKTPIKPIQHELTTVEEQLEAADLANTLETKKDQLKSKRKKKE